MPHDLPSPQPMFVARAAELSRMDEHLAPGRPIVISGMAGVGKTSLALHWAHRVADRFPDGQLYLNLRGFHPGRVMTTGEALRQLLGSLGVLGDRVPAETDAAERLYRTTLTGRRVLVVLDNVADAEQVRPLLPPGGCLAVLTSRRELTGLVVAEAAHPLPLRPLDDEGARALLAQRLGAGRIAGESAAAGRIITACGGLPLALAVVAARSAVNPSFSLADIAAQLARTAGGLDAMHSDDVSTDVRAAFSYSYDSLPVAARRMFRALGPHPGPEITEPAAAALAGTTPATAQRELARLTRAQLLIEHRPGRYALHDLLRAYATELGEELDTPQDRQAAQDRLIVHFVHGAHAAGTAINPFRAAMELPAGDRPATVAPCDDETTGLAWFAAEIRVLLAVFELAVRTGRDREAWQLAWGMGEFLDRNGDWREWVTVQTTALEAARRIGDRGAQAFSHRVAANGYLQLGRPDDAFAHLEQANDLYLGLGDTARAAHCLYLTAWARDLQGRGSQGLEYTERAIALARRADHPVVLGFALNMAGHLLAGLGEHRQALEKCAEALELQRKAEDRVGLSATLDTLGVAFHGLGRYDLAAEHYREGIELHAELGDHYHEADMAVRLGATYLAQGEVAAARESWQRALRILDSLDHPDAAGVRERLAGSPG
ncbi:tetratricopeptide repeat protein [Actinoplanes sp. NEAU-A12]|uniref:Tetratricopeptide repeat protein n=1 Tax=Actinoplanes sandaracinus TaxID=3045177 RepID=A0ABT6WX64_9ACTN|nr:tetratricopeptide repeat protein [Actinoplanes sandaracinus]MDI6104284.1 tetratricopeptide repeat protein [Actinoplanes sandaracinus]